VKKHCNIKLHRTYQTFNLYKKGRFCFEI